VGEHVLLKVNPKKSSLNLGSCTKLEGIFGCPFEILNITGLVVNILAFPASMNVHNVFDFSLIKKYVHDPNHVIDWHMIHVEIEGHFQVEPMRILDKKVKMIWN
jgi:hypothetical protein